MQAQKPSDPRERILEAADYLFYREGVRATGTERIMAESGVAKATFYRHFPSKDDLVVAYLACRDRSFFEAVDSPAPPKDIHEALARIERVINHPDIIGCPFLRIASEYPDTAHPFHRVATEHENRFHAYLTNLLEPIAIDRQAAAAAMLSVIDGGLTTRMLFGKSREIPILAPAEAVLKSFQTTRTKRRT
ncbi:TetR/AcrR family transcriptional regulator [Terriglobus roseus]|uniref:Transcriptional regulator, TetR family n=1 Tax=Terriglobus roseus TaxID=392734 RepID=A0A1H4J620_9BACT|nr:TetR/AcrR family transcriptional regulator [Terriglobus roseus]SEB41661.1 transcriptional regulator, TetR family [Terriglobus roseus]